MANHQASGPQWSRAKRIVVNLLLIVGGLVTGLLIAEMALRISGYTYPEFYTTDEARGYALKAGLSGWYRKEGESYVRINSDGLRDREHAKAKPPNTVRIALLGDSYAEAFQVPMENAFWVLMEKRLQGCAAFKGKNVEVINFGVSGYGTAQELITLRQHVWEYAPDIVMLAMTTNNDISDNSRVLKKTDEIPYFVYRGDQLVLDDSFRQVSSFRLRNSALNVLGRWLRDNLRVIQAFNQIHHALKNYLATRKANVNQPAPTGAQTGKPTAVAAEDVGIDNLIYREPVNPVWNDAWRVTEGLLVQMRDEVQNRGAKFIVVTLSNGIQVFPYPSGRQSFMQRIGVSDLFYPDRRIKALGEREGFPVINLAPALHEYAEQNRAFLHGFGNQMGNGHWNVLGHQVAGEMLAQRLCEELAQENQR